MTKFSKGLLIDTGFLFALYDERDSYHSDAQGKVKWLECFPIILPWPVLYETINTRFSRRKNTMNRFHLIVDAPDTIILDDTPYRGSAYKSVLTRTRIGQPLSLVDAVLCSVIEDTNVAVEAMLTFNPRDFVEACTLNSVELL